jgi:hypothetical protein
MKKGCSIPVAQALQRHSGGWKASPPIQPKADERVPDEHEDAPPRERVAPQPRPGSLESL